LDTRYPGQGDILNLMQMGVCPIGLFGSFEIEAWRLYRITQARGWPWPVYEEPAVFARAVEVITNELAAIEAEKPDDGG
jgi:hypothetical protein